MNELSHDVYHPSRPVAIQKRATRSFTLQNPSQRGWMRLRHSARTVQKKETGLVTEKVQEVFAEQVYESGSSLPRI